MSEQSEFQELQNLRQQIDNIDLQLLNLFNQRAKFAQQIGKVKEKYKSQATEKIVSYRPEREKQILNALQQNNSGPLPNSAITLLFRELMSACLALERPLKIAFLGPNGTFSESAAIRHFGKSADFIPCRSIEAVFRSVENYQVDYAVVPIENSIEGAVGNSLDLLLSMPSEIQIIGEVFLRINHQLLVKNKQDFANANFAEIKKVYAHHQALAQCHNWLVENAPNALLIPQESNALAAQKVAENLDSNEKIAAIASLEAAERYNLQVLQNNIENNSQNTTRFIVLGKQQVPPAENGNDKTSLIMAAPNRIGSLHELLMPFAACGVSLTKLVSRPVANALWQYVFFVDIEGHKDGSDQRVKLVLAELQKRATFLKVLGSYPKSAF